MRNTKKIAIIGAGNGGQAYAGYLASLGHSIALYDRDKSKVEELRKLGKINLVGQIESENEIDVITDNLEEAIRDANRIYIVTVANAHKHLALEMAPMLKNDQTIILSPGRTNGALEFEHVIKKYCNKNIFIGETQTLVFACRIVRNGTVRIIGIKDKVLISAIPNSQTSFLVDISKDDFHCFIPAKNVLHTSLENFGAILHPVITILNAATIERGNQFYFYEDLTPLVTGLILKLDNERIAIGNQFNLRLNSIEEWVSYSYKGIKGTSLVEKIKNNPAYSQILGPSNLNCRMLTEDIPTGLIPMIDLAQLVGIKTPHMETIVSICNSLLNINFYATGRVLKKLEITSIQGLVNSIT